MNIMARHAIIEKWSEGMAACTTQEKKEWKIIPMFRIEKTFTTQAEAYEFLTDWIIAFSKDKVDITNK